jgi:hypothetical protein
MILAADSDGGGKLGEMTHLEYVPVPEDLGAAQVSHTAVHVAADILLAEDIAVVGNPAVVVVGRIGAVQLVDPHSSRPDWSCHGNYCMGLLVAVSENSGHRRAYLLAGFSSFFGLSSSSSSSFIFFLRKSMMIVDDVDTRNGQQIS